MSSFLFPLSFHLVIFVGTEQRRGQGPLNHIPLFTPDLPLIYPSCIPYLPLICPSFTTYLPFIYILFTPYFPFFTPYLPFIYPLFTLYVPLIYPLCTPQLSAACRCPPRSSPAALSCMSLPAPQLTAAPRLHVAARPAAHQQLSAACRCPPLSSQPHLEGSFCASGVFLCGSGVFCGYQKDKKKHLGSGLSQVAHTSCLLLGAFPFKQKKETLAQIVFVG